MTIFEDAFDLTKENVPILGSVLGGVENIVGGLTGESDIGKTGYQVPYYQIDPGMYYNPTLQGFVTSPEISAYEQQRQQMMPQIDAQKEQYRQYIERQFQDYLNQTLSNPTNRQKYEESIKNDPNFEQKFKDQFIKRSWNDQGMLQQMFQEVGQPIEFGAGPQPRSLRDRLIDQALGLGQDTSATEGFLKASQYQGGYDPVYEAYKRSGQYEAPSMGEYDQQFWGTGMNAAPITSELSDIYRQYGGQSRDEQLAGLGLLGAAARGEAPSQAEIQMQIGLEQAANQQMAAARSARGGLGAQMLAERNAANQGALMQQAGINQQAALRAQEMAAARQAYTQGAQGLRGADISAMSLADQMEIQDALLRQEAQRITVQNAQEAGMLGENNRVKFALADMDSKLKTMGYNIQDRTNMLNAYLDKLGIDQRNKGMYMDAYLKSRGYDINERQNAMSNVLGIDTRTMAGNQAMAGAAQGENQFRTGLQAGIAQGNAAAQQQAFGSSLNFFGGLASGIGSGMFGGNGGGSTGGGGSSWNPNFGSTPSFYGGGSPQPVQPVGLGDNIIDPWENG